MIISKAICSFLLFVIMFIGVLWIKDEDKPFLQGLKSGTILWIYTFPPYALLSIIFSLICDSLVSNPDISTAAMMKISVISAFVPLLLTIIFFSLPGFVAVARNINLGDFKSAFEIVDVIKTAYGTIIPHLKHILITALIPIIAWICISYFIVWLVALLAIPFIIIIIVTYYINYELEVPTK